MTAIMRPSRDASENRVLWRTRCMLHRKLQSPDEEERLMIAAIVVDDW